MNKEILEIAALMIETDMVMKHVDIKDYNIRPILDRVLNIIVQSTT